jgi:hypothetical protein
MSTINHGFHITTLVMELKQRRETNMCLIPLPERRRINLNDGALDEGVCPDQFIVRSIVYLQPESINLGT